MSGSLSYLLSLVSQVCAAKARSGKSVEVLEPWEELGKDHMHC